MLHWFALAVPSPNASLQPADDVRALRELVSDVQYELEQLKRHQMEAELAHSENIAGLFDTLWDVQEILTTKLSTKLSVNETRR